jgi:hypothetical protein
MDTHNVAMNHSNVLGVITIFSASMDIKATLTAPHVDTKEEQDSVRTTTKKARIIETLVTLAPPIWPSRLFASIKTDCLFTHIKRHTVHECLQLLFDPSTPSSD